MNWDVKKRNEEGDMKGEGVKTEQLLANFVLAANKAADHVEARWFNLRQSLTERNAKHVMNRGRCRCWYTRAAGAMAADSPAMVAVSENCFD
ncbi:hypothetical protein VNO80_02592 [Phaseolus coccineus]|uniref:Uncharacterized protein n=1 Tax=Phaseolus coccineus TaxID=3886 RepID=A0AAN9NQP8_PHACN